MKRLSVFLPLLAIASLAGAGAYLALRGAEGVQPNVRKPASGDGEIQDDELLTYEDWKRPAGPAHVALQAGHWKVAEAPEELTNLRGHGAYGGGKQEWEVVLEIAKRAKPMLEAKGVVVDILPATVPPEYWADAFVSIHADDSPSRYMMGYKVASSDRDPTGRADVLAHMLETSYGKDSGLPIDPNVTDDMRDYYAFNWHKFVYSVHPMTTAAIVETGYLTNAKDRSVIVRDPNKAARGIADGIISYLEAEGLIEKPASAQ